MSLFSIIVCKDCSKEINLAKDDKIIKIDKCPHCGSKITYDDGVSCSVEDVDDK
jgi:DNA-directed RNA polymerase subunit RPC12/RpoP